MSFALPTTAPSSGDDAALWWKLSQQCAQLHCEYIATNLVSLKRVSRWEQTMGSVVHCQRQSICYSFIGLQNKKKLFEIHRHIEMYRINHLVGTSMISDSFRTPRCILRTFRISSDQRSLRRRQIYLLALTWRTIFCADSRWWITEVSTVPFSCIRV